MSHIQSIIYFPRKHTFQANNCEENHKNVEMWIYDEQIKPKSEEHVEALLVEGKKNG